MQAFSFAACANDYGIKDLNFPNYVRDIRHRLNLLTAVDKEVNGNNRIFATGCQKLDISTRHFQLNRRDCIGCGYCAEGCAFDRKQGTMIAYFVDALQRGVQPRSLRGQVEVIRSGRSRRVDIGRISLRNSPQDRCLDKTSAVVNAEFRLPIVRRFGGVAGSDLGKVWDAAEKFDLHRWASNPVAGLRFYMDTFVVRLDVGFGHETTGFSLNFGHLF